MKTMYLGKYFLTLGIIAFLLISTVNAFGANATRKCDGTAGLSGSGCLGSNDFTVISPYWQVDSGSYTFIAVTHTSLSGMASQIGLHMNALTSSGVAYNTAATFTVTSGTTARVFIAPTTHATVNATSIPTAKFIAGTSGFTYGKIVVTPVMTHPQFKYIKAIASRDGAGFRDITMLSYWGSVIIEANTTGFAMEFLGDMNDSITLMNRNPCWEGADAVVATSKSVEQACSAKNANGTNPHLTMGSGPNLQ